MPGKEAPPDHCIGVRLGPAPECYARALQGIGERAGLDLTLREFRVEQVLWGLAGLAASAALTLVVALRSPGRTLPLLVLCAVAFAFGVLLRENRLTSDDLIWPIFLIDGTGVRQPVPSMPGVERLSVDEAIRDAGRAAKLGIPAIALFPFTEHGLRDETGSEALNPNNLVCTACRAM